MPLLPRARPFATKTASPQTQARVLQEYAQCLVSTAVFNIRWYSQFNAILNIVRTLFITFALGFAMITFSKDAQRLVLRPIERMLRKVTPPPPH